MAQGVLPRVLPNIARPPTPPREAQKAEEPSSSVAGPFTKDGVPRTLSNLTPDSSAESSNISNIARKKVNWPDNNRTASSPVVETPPVSTGLRHPIKSILKPYHGINSFSIATTSKLSPPHAYPNLAAMLESILQQLGGDDRDSKLDAYTTLAGTIMASENVPEIRALRARLPALVQFMKRDMTAKTTAGLWDTSLIVNNLVLLSTFLHRRAIAQILPAEFCAFVIDHVNKTLEFKDFVMSKDVIKHLLFIVAKQNFASKVMTAARVGKLDLVLNNLDIHVKGKSIVNGRLDIYKNLLRNSRSHMLGSTYWLGVLFSDMQSSIKETRNAAISFGFEVAAVFGAEEKASRAVMALFQKGPGGDNQLQYGHVFAARLQEMISQKSEGGSVNVPQIWSIVVLFFRRPRQFERWEFSNPWLHILGGCFNSSDLQTKLEANMAWNRLVFAIRPDETTSKKLVAMLRRPLVDQVKRRHKSTSSKPRTAAISSICFLLYYSLKPESPSGQLDLYWDEFVKEIVGKSLTPMNVFENTELARRDLTNACQILNGLFDITTSRPWAENRAINLSAVDITMRPAELPALDSKWLRKNSARVFAVVQPLLEKLYWELKDDRTICATLWKSYIASVASPAVKEVKVSIETMSCVACLFELLFRVWNAGPGSIRSLLPEDSSESPDFVGSFSSLISTAIDGFGLLPYTEKLLSMGTQDEFIVIATPSQRPKNSRGEAQCPLHHLFALLTNVCPGLVYDHKFYQMVRQILAPFFDARPSSKSQQDLVKDLLRLLPVESTEPTKILWQVLAEFATTATDVRDGTSNGNTDLPLGAEYRSSLKMLELGVELSAQEPLPGWKTMFEALVTGSTLDAGDGGRAIAVVEPLARAFTANSTKDSPLFMPGAGYCRLLISKATYPKDRQALDAARRRMWGAANTTHKASSFDPYIQLYEYLRWSLESAYSTLTKEGYLECADLLSATTALLNRCPASTLGSVFEKLQTGIGCWILDEESKLAGGNALSQAVTSLWNRVCNNFPHIIQATPQTKSLADFQVLLCSGLGSKHRTIVTSTVRLWNSTYGKCEDKLEYPDRVTQALLRLRSIADLNLPFFPENLSGTEEEAQDHQSIHFAESQEASLDQLGSKNLSAILRMHPSAQKNRSALKRAETRITKQQGASRASNRRISTPTKLRHEDSQIQFEAIDSSPIASTIMDSQLLTDRQKEVKERQETEGAMFPDIRSSPRARSSASRRMSSSTDLSLHRSASKSAAPHMDYDDYVHSSPTPVRSKDVGEHLSGPASSPTPESNDNQVSKYGNGADDADIPSSPPELPEAFNMEDLPNSNLTSIGPSAQIDPDAIENDRVVSTFEYTPEDQAQAPYGTHEASSIGKPFSTTEVIASTEAENHSSSVEYQAQEVVEAKTPPNADSPTPIQTPRPVIFHDALESPISSDRGTSNNEVFQDSFSSPVMAAEEPRNPSPLSEINDSSMIRLMAKFDEGSGRPKSSGLSRSEPIEEAITEKMPESTAIMPPMYNFALPKPMNTQTTPVDPQPIEAPDQTNKSSTGPSVIPETPGPCAAAIVRSENTEDLDEDNTIVVDIPSDLKGALNIHLFPEFQRRQTNNVTKRRSFTKKASPRKRLSTQSPAARKRSYREISSSQSEVPDSQEVNVEPIILKDMPPPKRKRGRPRKSGSVTPSQSDTNSQIASSPRFQSVDLDALVQSSQGSVVATEDFIALSRDLMDDDSATPLPSVEGLELNPEVVTRDSVEARPRISTNGDTNPDLMDVDVAPESVHDGLATSVKPNVATKTETRPEEGKKLPSEEQAPASPLQKDVTMQIEALESTTMQDMKKRLQALIGYLGKAALTRDEVNAFEDMFMDAKEQLYGAGRRGRARHS